MSVHVTSSELLTFFEPVVAVGERTDLNEALRFSVARLAEYLDPGVHFNQSASFRPGPLTVLAELEENCRTYLEPGSAIQPRTMRNRAGDVLDFLDRTERFLSHWFRAEHSSLMQSLGAAAASSTNPNVLEPLIRQVAVDTAALRSVAGDSAIGYPSRLIAHIVSLWQAPPTTETGWRSFDRDLLDLGAQLLAAGRSGEATVHALAGAVLTAADDASAIVAALGVINASKRTFLVAALLDGTTDVEGATHYGCERLGYPAEWGTGDDLADRRLRTFLTTRRDGRKRCAFRVRVDAWDEEDAFDSAVTKSLTVADRATAAHRTSRFTLLEEGLVFQPSTRRVTPIPINRDAGPSRAHMLAATDAEPLRASLRYAGLSRTERLPVVSVTHAWIAMECLAEGARQVRADGTYGDPQGPATYLPKRLAALLSLAAVANLWPRSWDIASKTGRHECRIETWWPLLAWLGSTDNPDYVPSLATWGEVLVAAHVSSGQQTTLTNDGSAADAAAYLRYVLEGWPPYAQHRLSEIARLLYRGKALDDWANRMYDQALANVHRFQLMRHRVVHTALYEIEGAKQLALASQGAIDAVYEVLPHWIGANALPWQALDEVFRWRRSLFRQWTKNESASGFRRPFQVDPRQIARRTAF